MATTYMQLARQIKELEAQAEQVKKKEIAGVISQVKDAIAAYGLTAEDLGLAAGAGTRSKAARASGAPSGPHVGRKLQASRKSATTTYQDGTGNTWGGRGPRPSWLRAALAAGASLASFAVGGSQVASATASPVGAASVAAESTKTRRTNKAAAEQKKRASTASYKDDAGNSWSGFGPKPRWFKEALAAGKTPEELKA